MSKFVVHAITNGTKVKLQAPGSTPERALWHVQRNRMARNADIFLVFERKTGSVVLAVQGSRQRF